MNYYRQTINGKKSNLTKRLTFPRQIKSPQEPITVRPERKYQVTRLYFFPIYQTDGFYRADGLVGTG